MLLGIGRGGIDKIGYGRVGVSRDVYTEACHDTGVLGHPQQVEMGLLGIGRGRGSPLDLIQ
jgi:hypothetical protein